MNRCILLFCPGTATTTSGTKWWPASITSSVSSATWSITERSPSATSRATPAPARSPSSRWRKPLPVPLGAFLFECFFVPVFWYWFFKLYFVVVSLLGLRYQQERGAGHGAGPERECHPPVRRSVAWRHLLRHSAHSEMCLEAKWVHDHHHTTCLQLCFFLSLRVIRPSPKLLISINPSVTFVLQLTSETCVTLQIPSRRMTCCTTASPPSPWSWMNSPRSWSLSCLLQTAACAQTKGEESNSKLLFLSLFVLFQVDFPAHLGALRSVFTAISLFFSCVKVSLLNCSLLS